MQGQQAYPPFQGQSSYSSRRKAGRTRKPNPHTSFPWTDPAQIAANAQGRVTPQQRGMLKQRPGVLAGLLAYLSFFALSPSLLLFISTHQPPFLLLFFVPCGLTLLAVAWPFIQNAHRLHAPGPIMTAQGEVVWQKDRYVVQTAERRLNLAHRTLDPPLPGPYHFYYLADGDILLSAQPISTTTGMLAYPNLLAGSGLPGHQQARLALQEALFSTLNFTPDDLAANRMGILSERQRTQISRRVSAGVVFSLLGLPAGVTLGTASAFVWHQVVWSLVSISFGLLCAYNLAIATPRKRAELRQGTVQSREGYVRAREVSGGDDSSSDYYYDLDTLSFKVNSAAYKALVDRTRYRLYYLPFMKTLLSIEPLEDPRHM